MRKGWGTGHRKGPQLARGRARLGDPAGVRQGRDSPEAASCWEPGDAGKGERGREGGRKGGREGKPAAGSAAKGGESEGEGRDRW